jgi:hypothetical protein
MVLRPCKTVPILVSFPKTPVNAPLDELAEAGLSPTDSLESAFWPIFKPSVHTAILSGISGETGVGLIELNEY